MLYRGSPALVLAQVWGAFCFGVGYAAIRRRTGSILWLMVLHAVTDFAGAITAGPALLFFIGQDAVLLGLGLILVLRETAAVGHDRDPLTNGSLPSSRA